MKTLLLVGSPKPGASTSGSMAAYLSENIIRNGGRSEILSLVRLIKTEEGIANLLDKISAADAIVMIFPLYVDSLPWPVIRTLEIIGRAREKGATSKRLAVITNCGFPESSHNDLATDICRTFARKTGFEWAGSLSLGAGGFIDGKDLSKMGGPAQNVKVALDMAGRSLSSGEDIPQEATHLMAKNVMSPGLYLFMGKYAWHYMAFRNKALRRIRARPYTKEG